MASEPQTTRIASSIGAPLACFAFSSLLVLTAVWLGVAHLPTAAGEPPGRRTMLDAMLTWDGGWYKAIALRGYDYKPHQNSSVAFFPVYPLASLDVAMLTGMPLEAAMVAVSHLCFAVALVTLAAYCRQRWPGEQRLQWFILLACAFFPAGCFFHMAYSESCFLFLSLLAFYGFDRRWPLAVTASIVGLATAARPTAVVLLAPLAIHIWQSGSSPRSRLLALAAWLPVGCWGLAAYMVYQGLAFGNPLAFVDSQMSWHIRPPVPMRDKWLALATLEPVRAVYSSGSPAYWRRWGGAWPLNWHFSNPLFFLSACFLIALGWRRRWLSRGEASFSALLLLIPYLARGYEMGMVGMARFVSVAFPIYIVLGQLFWRMPRWAAFLGLLAMASYLAIFSALFAAARFVI